MKDSDRAVVLRVCSLTINFDALASSWLRCSVAIAPSPSGVSALHTFYTPSLSHVDACVVLYRPVSSECIDARVREGRLALLGFTHRTKPHGERRADEWEERRKVLPVVGERVLLSPVHLSHTSKATAMAMFWKRWTSHRGRDRARPPNVPDLPTQVDISTRTVALYAPQ